MTSRADKKQTKHKMTNVNNIWDRDSFRHCIIGKNNKAAAILRNFNLCVKWSLQRIIRGYSDYDKNNMYSFLQNLIPDMLQDMRDNRFGSPGFLGENYVTNEGILMNETCHDEWNKILDYMVFLWREANEETCTRCNPYESEYMKAFDDFIQKYGLLGEKLQTPEELEQMNENGMRTYHSMSELEEYNEIYEKYHEEKKKIDVYRENSKDLAFDMLKEYFYHLWS